MGCTPTKEEMTVVKSDDVTEVVKERAKAVKEVSLVRQAAEAAKYSLMNGYVHDPRCPLTERQLYTLLKSWKAINRQISTTAINMFMRFFETNSDAQAFFTKFDATQTVSELRVNGQFESHALVVICTIDEVINNLDDMDYVISLIDSVAGLHVNSFGTFDADTFWKMQEPFLMAVRETLGDRFTISLEQCYEGCIKYLLKGLIDGLNLKRIARSDMTADTSGVKGEPDGRESEKVTPIVTINGQT